jgi:hypothetical protein
MDQDRIDDRMIDIQVQLELAKLDKCVATLERRCDVLAFIGLAEGLAILVLIYGAWLNA